MYCQQNLLDSVELGVLSSVVLISSIVSSLFSSMDLRNCHVTPLVKLPMLRRDLLLTALTLGSWAVGSNSMVVMGSGLSWESSPLFDCCSWATELETKTFGMVASLEFVASWVWRSIVPGKWIQQQYSYCGNHALLCLGRPNVWPITNYDNSSRNTFTHYTQVVCILSQLGYTSQYSTTFQKCNNHANGGLLGAATQTQLSTTLQSWLDDWPAAWLGRACGKAASGRADLAVGHRS